MNTPRIGKRRTGRLFRHGAGYAVQWTVNGKRMFQTLRDKDGNPITDKREAETARAVLMAPYRAADEKAALENIVGKLAAVTAEAARLEDETATALQIGQAWATYLAAPVDANRKRKPGNRPDSGPVTLKRYGEQWDTFAAWIVKAHPDAKALRQVTEDHAAEYAAHLSNTVGPGAFNKHVGLLTLVFHVLAGNRDARLTCNPFANIGRRRAAQNTHRELTADELRRVCGAATGELRTLFAIGTYTGLRLGDAVTLRWQETDLIRGTILRVPNKTARRSQKPLTIPLHQTLAAILADTPEKRRRGYVLPDLAALYLRDGSALTKRVQAHFAANGVQTTREGTGFTKLEKPGPRGKLWQHTGRRAVVEVGFHSLRHTFVSLCRQSGAPLAVVEAIVGHASPAMTRHYTHVGEAAARASVAALPSVLGDATAPAALPAPEPWRAQIRQLADKLTTANVEETRRAMLAL
jgi:integrase